MATELDPQQSPPTTSLKRRQSEVLEQENKRLRASPGKTSPDPETARASAHRDSDAPNEEGSRRESTDKAAGEQSPPREDARRKSSAVNEKDRSRRLFGGLLGSLSQKGDSRTTKRRQEIESRRKAELQRQDDEHVEDKQRRLEQLAEKRKRVKKQLEDESVCFRRCLIFGRSWADHATRCATDTATYCTARTSFELQHNQDS
jgi:hypothetical protein